MLERIIFAIDSPTDTYRVMQFAKHCATQKALGRMGKVQHLVGCYKGQLECSYMVRAIDWHHVKQFCLNQESILRVPGDVRQPCVLEYLSTGERVSVGPMAQVEPLKALQCDAWTYDLEKGKYYVCQ